MTAELKSLYVQECKARTGTNNVNEADDRLKALNPAERECKDLVYQRLLKVMDLSLIGNLEDREARSQIREIC